MDFFYIVPAHARVETALNEVSGHTIANDLINIDNRADRREIESKAGTVVRNELWIVCVLGNNSAIGTNERTEEEQRFCLRRRADNNRRLHGR